MATLIYIFHLPYDLFLEGKYSVIIGILFFVVWCKVWYVLINEFCIFTGNWLTEARLTDHLLYHSLQNNIEKVNIFLLKMMFPVSK